VVRDTTEPSVLAHEILNGRPFTFLDDAPLEERRSRAVPLRRGLPVAAGELGRLDPAAIERVEAQVRPEPRDPDELHDLLMTVVALRPAQAWQPMFDTLVAGRRAAAVHGPAGVLWCAVERRPAIEALFPDAAIVPDHPCPVRPATQPDEDAAAAELLRGHLDCRGPSTTADLAQATGLPENLIVRALARLEEEGFALRGRFTAAAQGGAEEFCARRLLARIHGYTRQRQRSEIEPVNARDFMRFLLRWQHVEPGTRREGRFGVLAVVEQLQGYELAAGAWETGILAARVDGYKREWLDELCLSGQVTWERLSLRDSDDDPPRRGGLAPSRATPITLSIREDLPWLLRAVRGEATPAEPGPGRARDIIDALRQHGALFRPDLAAVTGRLPAEVEEALWEGVARGLITADGFRAVRSLLRRGGRPGPARRGLRHGIRGTSSGSTGRWCLLPTPAIAPDRDELAEAVAEQLAARWGVIFRDLARRENLAVPWRDVLWALRRMEARGTIRGGRFVAGFSGEQYAHPDAVDLLRAVRKERPTGQPVRLSATDPLNLTAVVLPGPRIPAIPANSVTYVDGAVPAAAATSA
jgi:ATP-dependent helicase Lhr and Lhr-like helicase